jgi:hypothetical protein
LHEIAMRGTLQVSLEILSALSFHRSGAKGARASLTEKEGVMAMHSLPAFAHERQTRRCGVCALLNGVHPNGQGMQTLQVWRGRGVPFYGRQAPRVPSIHLFSPTSLWLVTYDSPAPLCAAEWNVEGWIPQLGNATRWETAPRTIQQAIGFARHGDGMTRSGSQLSSFLESERSAESISECLLQ